MLQGEIITQNPHASLPQQKKDRKERHMKVPVGELSFAFFKLDLTVQAQTLSALQLLSFYRCYC